MTSKKNKIMYILFEFRGEVLVAKRQVFKMHFESRGAKYIKESDCFDELVELSNKIKLI